VLNVELNAPSTAGATSESPTAALGGVVPGTALGVGVCAALRSADGTAETPGAAVRGAL
jgi:hypothetical protein